MENKKSRCSTAERCFFKKVRETAYCEEQEEKAEVNLLVCFSTDDGETTDYSWYIVNPTMEADDNNLKTKFLQLNGRAPFHGLGCAYLDNKLYVIGCPERGGSHFTSSVYVSQVGKTDLVEGVPMQGAKNHPKVVAVNGKIYAFGCYDNSWRPQNGPQPPVEHWAEVFDPSSNQWSDVADVPQVIRVPPQRFVLQSQPLFLEECMKFLVLPNNWLSGLYSFDIRNNKWDNLAEAEEMEREKEKETETEDDWKRKRKRKRRRRIHRPMLG